ncbi:hypothetical protein L345_11111, partial [Ophiophagus hannah]
MTQVWNSQQGAMEKNTFQSALLVGNKRRR